MLTSLMRSSLYRAKRHDLQGTFVAYCRYTVQYGTIRLVGEIRMETKNRFALLESAVRARAQICRKRHKTSGAHITLSAGIHRAAFYTSKWRRRECENVDEAASQKHTHTTKSGYFRRESSLSLSTAQSYFGFLMAAHSRAIRTAALRRGFRVSDCARAAKMAAA